MTGFSVGYYKKAKEIFPIDIFSTLATLRMFIYTVSNEENTYIHSCNTITSLQDKVLKQVLDLAPLSVSLTHSLTHSHTHTHTHTHTPSTICFNPRL
jgi:hypothetical protein